MSTNIFEVICTVRTFSIFVHHTYKVFSNFIILRTDMVDKGLERILGMLQLLVAQQLKK